MSQPEDPSRSFGRYRIRAAERQLLADGRPVALGARAFDLLLALFDRRDRVVPKAELLELVWPGLVVEENNLQVQVSGLRKLLGPGVVCTIPGRGYRFTAPADGTAGTAPDGDAGLLAETRLAADVSPATPAAVPGNLPHVAPVLFGRDEAVAALLALIATQPLVTLAGAGGMGKTALARALAHALRERYRDGVWWVDLAPLTDPAQVARAVAAALKLTLAGEGSAMEQLVHALANHSILLVLNNCEPVVDATAALAEALLEGAGHVRLLITCQGPLHIAAEHVWRVGPLALPAMGTPVQGGEFGAVQLFAERARAVEPRFVLDGGNDETVADICRRLDGMPLAIELAAARVPALGLQRLRDGLGERFRLLTAGARTAPRRHQTLRATVDWSHALLPAAEQVVFRRLGIFVGGFSLGLAQQVARDDKLDDWGVLDALSGLVDKSLVVVDAGKHVRYRLLETMRAYALEKLADANETPILMERHALAMSAFFTQLWEMRPTLGPAVTRQLSEPELDNARAALVWAGSAVDGTDATSVTAAAIVLAAAVARLLLLRGQGQEALRCMQAWIDRVDDSVHPVVAARFWTMYAVFGDSGRLPGATAQDALTRAERLWRRRGEHCRLYGVLCSKAASLHETGRHREAEALMREILALEDPAWPAWVRKPRVHAALLGAMLQGRLEEALQLRVVLEQLRAADPGDKAESTSLASLESLIKLGLGRFDEVLAITEAFDGRFGPRHPDACRWVHAHRAFALMFLDRTDEATQAVRRDIDTWRRDGLLLRYCGHLALLVAKQGRLADAVRLDGAAEAHVARSGMVRGPSATLARRRLRQLFEESRLKADDVDRWRREGEVLDEESLVALCLGEELPMHKAGPRVAV